MQYARVSKLVQGRLMADDTRFALPANTKVVKATGVFGGVRKARLAERRGDDGKSPVGRSVELSLDSWEAPLVFDVTAVERERSGSTVYRGTAPRAAGSREVIAMWVELNTRPSADGGEDAWRIEVTRSTEGGPPDSLLELRGDAT
jgi:hypothetical protein